MRGARTRVGWRISGEALILEGEAYAQVFEVSIEQVLSPTLSSGHIVILDKTNRRAVANPMPLVPPVINAVLFFSFISISFGYEWFCRARRSPGTIATFGEVSCMRRRVLHLPSPVFTLEQLDCPAFACILHRTPGLRLATEVGCLCESAVRTWVGGR